MSALTHLLVCLFGTGSWVSVNGLWVELPLIVPQVPEGWHLPSYLSVIIQAANVGPLALALAHRLRPGGLDERAAVYAVLALGTLATFLLAFFWKETLVVAGAPRSVAFLVLAFFLATVDCTSSVTFLPFMARLEPRYLTTYYVGEGASGLLPALVALVQGAGAVDCVRGPGGRNASEAVPAFRPARFSPEVFFFFLSAIMLACSAAFLLLNRRATAAEGRARGPDQKERAEERPMAEAPMVEAPMVEAPMAEAPMAEAPMAEAPRPRGRRSRFGLGTYGRTQVFYIFAVLAWSNALTNGVLPSVQSYSCAPYGNKVYHLSSTVAAASNPLACLVATFFPVRSLRLMGALTALGSGVGVFILSMAALSPCPLLVNDPWGGAIMVAAWMAFVLSLSYVKVIIGVILRDEGHGALVWCGAVVQLGSLLGALAVFPAVSVYNLFASGDPCKTQCP
ncbi:solute carrier family 52, riboflavin transporter, member 3-B [Stigmatopora argus]